MRKVIGLGKVGSGSTLSFGNDILSQIQYGRIRQVDHTSIGAGLFVFTLGQVIGSEIISDCLFIDFQGFSNSGYTAGR